MIFLGNICLPTFQECTLATPKFAGTVPWVGGAGNTKEMRKGETQDASFMGRSSQGREASEWPFQLQFP